MSDILNLAKDFKTKSQEQAKDIDKHALNVLNTLEQRWTAALKQSEQRLQSVIQDHEQSLNKSIVEQQKRTNRAVLKSYMAVGLVLFLTLSLGGGALWWQGQRLIEVQQQIEASQVVLDRVNSQGGALKFSRCDNRLCVQIDPDAPKYQDNYMIPRGY